MAKLEAKELMKAGVKVTHRLFEPEEWITMKDNSLIAEDYPINEAEFWKYRQSEAFEKDWSIWVSC